LSLDSAVSLSNDQEPRRNGPVLSAEDASAGACRKESHNKGIRHGEAPESKAAVETQVNGDISVTGETRSGSLRSGKNQLHSLEVPSQPNAPEDTEAGSASAKSLPTPTTGTSSSHPATANGFGGPSGHSEMPASPSSTIGLDSKASNTPRNAAPSADTSPDNEMHTGALDGLDKAEADDEPSSSPGKANLDPQNVDGSDHAAKLWETVTSASQGAPGAQLRSEEAASRDLTSSSSGLQSTANKPAQSSTWQNTTNGEARQGGMSSSFEAKRLAQELLEDEEDEVVGVPTPEDEAIQEQADAKVALLARQTARLPSGNDDSLPPGRTVPDHPIDMDLDQRQPQSPSSMEDGVQASSKQDDGDKDGDIEMEDASSDAPAGPKGVSGIKSPSRHNDLNTSKTNSSAATPSIQSPPPLERMTTRVSSGAIRHKSVSEILGETPKPANTEKTEPSASTQAPRYPASTGVTPSGRIGERREKDNKSKLSTVIFAKQQGGRKDTRPSSSHSNLASTNQGAVEVRDYFELLFASQATQVSGGKPLEQLLQSAHKTLTTENHYVSFHELQDTKILKHVHLLQSKNLWSFRQQERSAEPTRQYTHWDKVLQDMKWMRTDFREERKWKFTAAKSLADACADWVVSTPEERLSLQVKITPRIVGAKANGEGRDEDIPMEQAPTPELDPSGDVVSESDTFDEDPHMPLFDTVAPASIFSLPPDDVVFSTSKSPATDKLFNNLPLYEPARELPSHLVISPDAEWRTPIVPVSKFVQGKMAMKRENSPSFTMPEKRSRYEFEEESEDDEAIPETPVDPVFGYSRTPKKPRFELPPESSDVALFNPEYKHIRDRIRASNIFRPPSEFNMPPQSFFENRLSSHWTFEEDDQLRNIAKEFYFNWSLISSMLQPKSRYTSSAERRTPWECFERWVKLESLPAEMQKTQYFRTYQNRIETAQRNSTAQRYNTQNTQNAAQLGGNGNPGTALTPQRRRTSQPIGVERRKNSRHLSLIEAMRKLAKKRETTAQKQQHCKSLLT
jgi:chromatin modification-related protein VID21